MKLFIPAPIIKHQIRVPFAQCYASFKKNGTISEQRSTLRAKAIHSVRPSAK
jgi:hypothetical protein